MNDGIDRQITTLSYVEVKDAAEGIRSFGTGTLLAKLDVKRAYRNIPVYPEDWWFLGMLWDNALFLDTTLPYGHNATIWPVLSPEAVRGSCRRLGVDCKARRGQVCHPLLG